MDDGVSAMLRTLNDAFPAVEPMSAEDARAAVAAQAAAGGQRRRRRRGRRPV